MYILTNAASKTFIRNLYETLRSLDEYNLRKQTEIKLIFWKKQPKFESNKGDIMFPGALTECLILN